METRSTMYQKMRELRAQLEWEIARFIQDNPEMSYREIGRQVGYSPARIAQLSVIYNVRRTRGRKPAAA